MISAWWYMTGVVVIAAILIIVPNDHQSLSYVFSETINSGFGDGTTSFGLAFLLVLGLGRCPQSRSRGLTHRPIRPKRPTARRGWRRPG